MSKKKPSDERKAIDDEFIRASFRKETAHGLLILFKASAKFREHNRKAMRKIKLAGQSMLNETKKIWFNLFAVLFVLSLMLASCSDSNNPVTPPGNNGTLIWTIDSLLVWRSTITNEPLHIDTAQFIDTANVKITFTGETNFDSTAGYASLHAMSFDTNFIYFDAYGKTAINKNFELYFNKSTYLKFAIYIYKSFTNDYKYVMFRNIKVYKLN